MAEVQNLNRFDARPQANKGVIYTLKNPEDMGIDLLNAGKPIRFRVHGTDSDRFIKANNAKRGDEMADTRKGVKFSQSLSDLRVRQLVAAAVSDWENIPKCWVEGGDDETPITYTDENCRKLFENLNWVQEQIDVFASDRKNFFGGSSTN